MAAGPYSADTLWFADTANLIVDPHDDVFLVFHKLSGDTHILNFLSAGVLETLKVGGPANFSVIATRVWEFLDLDEEDCPVKLIEDTVLQLDDVGVLYPVEKVGQGID